MIKFVENYHIEKRFKHFEKKALKIYIFSVSKVNWCKVNCAPFPVKNGN